MKDIIARHKAGEHVGICSVCSAHPLVIEAALRFDLNTDNKVLIEATSNQVNQFGGYTGMTPADFRDFVLNIARDVGFPRERLILGGDHLGPNCWQNEPAEAAMEKSVELIKTYVAAGFTKIHLDASMSCADDPVPLAPVVVAQRAAQLCKAAEETANEEQKAALTYVIGTEVPVPGGEASSINCVHVTRVEDAAQTLDTHRAAFSALGLEDAMTRVIAIVVQPGVEFDHTQIIPYQPHAAEALSGWIRQTPMVYEAHSTDYQTRQAYQALVRDHFAILKVGPALTFALREAIFALAQMERELIAPEQRSHVLEVIDEVMLNEPDYWKKYYRPTWSQAMVDIHFSLSDRIRYYWPHPRIRQGVEKLLTNMSNTSLPLGLISQFMPVQFERLSMNEIVATPHNLIIDKIQDVLRAYRFGCTPEYV
ncbi:MULTISPECIES: tagatose-bisphosphate aldolase subunit GatZ [Enterobacter]|uniref:D-tagatose-1,6-bisphosphate aldolase subunit GatZ n=1 Tax=Enterobacter kobei TaxID=208224 RepID=A0AAJ6IWC7_9ENTR|nr:MULTISPECIES: tagatose-bisphosphate aldolase subunit GatZ [Enterobacter]AFP71716.1 D-tagatose-1,6-bisphosphate aldolase subunit GatZ [Enterobacter kobei]AMZ76238.1 tagatose-bisphosphate aldolase [Enterobacter sp. ODB01]AOP88599.1 D-tagatose-bisphosphate aldolase, class II, non-catalytic subunit [Enterobacter kobei]EHF8262592.1 tagatose-bisphosphate aldolase subunit GatZ [Enterobacter kobei]ELE9691780.1 tagatose-bisphosphate aldolase subunit GatZ [Enterobacter kobei]